MTEADLGEWEGVTVDAVGRVIKLLLENNGLVGCIPSDIQQLSALQVLDLGNEPDEPRMNELTGSIPAELGRLTALVKLDLYNNKLTGPIPAALGQLGALTVLFLDLNELSGAIPAELRQLGALTSLYLNGNRLTGQEAFHAYMEEHHPDCDLLMNAEESEEDFE
jgi:Leucine-rich repeat (LRR) protein